MEVNIYGFGYELLATEKAKADIANNTWTTESYQSKDVEWWKVATMDNGDEMWMNNYDGVIIILTKGNISYYRNF